MNENNECQICGSIIDVDMSEEDWCGMIGYLYHIHCIEQKKTREWRKILE